MTSGSVSPFFAMYYKARGLLGYELGFLIAIPLFLNFFGSTLWTSIMDRTHKPKQILICQIINSAILVFSLSFNFVIRNYALTVVVVILFSLFLWPITPVVDSFVLAALGPSNKHLYGRQRMFSSFAWAVSAFFVSVIVDNTIVESFFYAYLFCAFIFLTFVIVLLKNPEHVVAPLKQEDNGVETDDQNLNIRNNKTNGATENSIFPEIANIDDDDDDDDVSQEFARKRFVFWKLWKTMKSIFTRRLLCFLLSSFFMGMGSSVVGNYIYLFLIYHLNATTTLFGLRTVAMIITEIVVFFFSKILLEKIGFFYLVIAAHIAYICRSLALASISNPWWSLLIEFSTHGIFFAAFWAAAVPYVNSLAPKHLQATCQGILNGCYSGLGGSCGAIIGGILYDRIGPVAMFDIFGGGVFLSLLWFLGTQYFLQRSEAKRFAQAYELATMTTTNEFSFEISQQRDDFKPLLFTNQIASDNYSNKTSLQVPHLNGTNSDTNGVSICSG